MKVYKFGGASVKDAKGVKNFLSTLQALNTKEVLIVISAMGKMTNAFESVVNAYFDKKNDVQKKLEETNLFHVNILKDLDFKKDHPVYDDIEQIFTEINEFMTSNNSTDYDYVYDQIVSQGEFLSTKICSAFLLENSIDHDWLDVRKCIKTNSDFRRARIDWETTCTLINKQVNISGMTITQGFLGSDNYGRTTTLGREGSDYTAGIFAYCLDAEEVSIFKDVQGVLNADPREFKRTTLLQEISYKEAIEMAFYGASVIHPKTLQPLQRKGIPLKVRSFLDTSLEGTLIGSGLDIVPRIPCFIVKKEQILISVSDREFHFVMEEDISQIFRLLHEFKMKVNLIQNSALSFSVCIENNFNNFKALLKALEPKYMVKYNEGLTLYTIRHFNEIDINEIEQGREVLLKQRSRETVQVIVKK
jgi:aspartate kinase